MTSSSPARLLLAPILATAAAALSLWLNVPGEATVSTPSLSAARDAAGRKEVRPAVARRNPRDKAELDRLWNRYANVDLEEEPVQEAWARAHREALDRLTVAARQAAFAGAPEPPQVVVGSRRCHTIRCRFSLCSPIAHEARLLDTTIQGITAAGASLWRHYRAVVIPPGKAMSPDDFCLEITVAFTSDDPALTNLVFAGEQRRPTTSPTPG